LLLKFQPTCIFPMRAVCLSILKPYVTNLSSLMQNALWQLTTITSWPPTDHSRSNHLVTASQIIRPDVVRHHTNFSEALC
jgi:hypothetical protein